MPNLCFLHPVGSVGQLVHFRASGVQNVDTLFHARVLLYGFDKKSVGTRFADLVFLHLLGSMGYIVHSRASMTQNVDTIFFMLGWHGTDSIKKCVGTRDAELVFLHPVLSSGHIVHSAASGCKMLMLFFHARVGPVQI
jgi:hypothetical protein